MALSLTLVVLILWGATFSNATNHVNLTTEASTEATTEDQGADLQEHAGLIIYFNLIYFKDIFFIISRTYGWIGTTLWVQIELMKLLILVK